MMKSVKFGNKNALEIIDTDLKKNIKDYLWDKTKIKILDKNYRILNYGCLHHLKKNPHLATLSTYGKKFMLCLLQIDDKNHTLFIDRKREMMVYMPMGFAESLYQGTIFDGELIKDNTGNWIYFITDISLYQGKSTFKISLQDRIGMVQQILTKQFQKNDLDFCRFEMKEYFPYQFLDDLCQGYRNRLKYKCSGLIFKNQFKNEKALMYIFPENRTPTTETDSTTTPSSAPKTAFDSTDGSVPPPTSSTKIKKVYDEEALPSLIAQEFNENDPSKEENKNFILKTTELPDVYHLFAKDATDKLVKVGLASVTSMDVSQYMARVVEKHTDNEPMVVRCRYVGRFKKWEPICLVKGEAVSKM